MAAAAISAAQTCGASPLAWCISSRAARQTEHRPSATGPAHDAQMRPSQHIASPPAQSSRTLYQTQRYAVIGTCRNVSLAAYPLTTRLRAPIGQLCTLSA